MESAQKVEKKYPGYLVAVWNVALITDNNFLPGTKIPNSSWWKLHYLPSRKTNPWGLGFRQTKQTGTPHTAHRVAVVYDNAHAGRSHTPGSAGHSVRGFQGRKILFQPTISQQFLLLNHWSEWRLTMSIKSTLDVVFMKGNIPHSLRDLSFFFL